MEKSVELTGPGVSSYEELEQILPADYMPVLPAKQRMQAVFAPMSSTKWRFRSIECMLLEQCNIITIQTTRRLKALAYHPCAFNRTKGGET